MFDFRKPSSLDGLSSSEDHSKSPFTSKVTLMLLGLVALLVLSFSIIGDYGLIARYRMENQFWSLQQEMQQLEKKKRALLSKVEALRSDPETLRFTIRQELGFVQKDELIYRIQSNTVPSQ